MKLAAALALVAATASFAAAEPNTKVSDERDPGTAIGISAGATAGSLALIAGGLAIGEHGGASIAGLGLASLVLTPSAGEWYAGATLTTGLGLRLGGLGALAIGGTMMLSELCFGEDCPQRGADYAPLVLAGVGAAAFVTGVIWDIADAGNAAERHNSAHQLAVAPTVIPSMSGPASGFALSGRF